MLRLFVVGLWMCALLTSTVGVSLVRIYCYCKGESATDLSLPWAYEASEEEGCAALGHKEEACCISSSMPTGEAGKGSCCRENPSGAAACPLDGETATISHTCTSKTVKVYHLKIDLHQPLSWELLFNLPLWADEVPNLWKSCRPALCYRQPSNKAPPEPPPPLSGRQICIRCAVFRC
jgi:hypothetical protein